MTVRPLVIQRKTLHTCIRPEHNTSKQGTFVVSSFKLSAGKIFKGLQIECVALGDQTIDNETFLVREMWMEICHNYTFIFY